MGLVKNISNFFAKGMWRSNDKAIQPKNTYYDSYNGRLIDFGDGNYAWENYRGNRLSFELCNSDHRPIGMTKISKYVKENNIDPVVFKESIVVFATNGSAGSITEITIDKDGGLDELVTRYTHADLNFQFTNQIEARGVYENANIRRVYWTDDLNQPRALNLQDFVNVPTGSLEVGEEYLVTCGTATHNGNPYTAGQTFTAVNANWTGTATVVKYIPVNQFNFSPEYIQGEIDLESIIAGSLYNGRHFYAYQLYSNGGGFSPWSVLSVGFEVRPETGPGDKLHYQDVQCGEASDSSGHGIQLKISGIDTEFDYIRVVCFRTTDFEVLDIGVVFYDSPITSTEMLINHTSYGGEEITFNAVTIYNTTIETAKTIDNIKYFNALGNITERPELDKDWDPSDTATFDYEMYELLSDGPNSAHNASDTEWGGAGYSPNAMTGHQTFDPAVGVASGNLYPRTWYRVTGGTVDYNGTTYGVGAPAGEYFYTNLTFYTYINPVGSPIVNPYIRIKRFYDHQSAAVVYKNIPYNGQFLDYKGEASSSYLRGFWGGEAYRLGALLFDKYGKPFYIRWLGDVSIPKRRDGGINYEMLGLYDGTVTADGNYYDHVTSKVMSIIVNNLDLTDIIDDISGIAFVVAERDEQNKMQGVLVQTEQNPFSATQTIMAARLLATNVRRPNIYTFLSPDDMCERSTFDGSPENKLIIDNYLRAIRPTTTDRMGLALVTNYHFTNKMYDEQIVGQGANFSPIDTENGIENSVSMGFNVQGYIGFGGYTIYGKGWYYDGANWREGFHGQGILVQTTETEGVAPYTNGFGDGLASIPSVPLVSLYQDKGSELYGGQSAGAKAATQYYLTGYYLPITAATKAQLETAPASGVYRLDNAQVFGGDCFVCLADYQRLYVRYLERQYGPDLQYGHSFIFPVQCKANFMIREGRHPSKNYTYEAGTNTTPDSLVYDLDSTGDNLPDTTRLEEFNYEDAYSTNYSQQILPSLPAVINFVNEFRTRVRYSEVKTLGEVIDSYREFLTNNLRDVETEPGEIVNIKSKDGRMYYWQRFAVGYFPVQERQLVVDNLGAQTELGTGEAFDRYDEKVRMIGNQHQWGLVEVPEGFVWYDAVNRSYIHMTTQFGLREESLVKGMQGFFEGLSNEIIDKDNPAHPTLPAGVFSYYDAEYKTVFTTFLKTTGGFEGHTIGYNRQLPSEGGGSGSFDSRQPFLPGIGMQFNDFLFLNNRDTDDFFKHHDETTPYGSFFGVNHEAYIVVIINDPIDIEKVFDAMQKFGNLEMFDDLTYTNRHQSINEALLIGGVPRTDYEQRNSTWIWNVPYVDETDKGRFRDTYLEVKFNIAATRNEKVRFLELKTAVRKTY